MAPAQHARRQQQARPVPRERPQRMRHDQADEADDAGHGRRRADAERRAGHHLEPRAAEIDAEAAGRVLAQRQRIERAAEQQQQGDAGQHERRRQPHLRQAAVGQRAHQPEHHLHRRERVLRQVERQRDRARWRCSTRRGRRGSASPARRALPASATTASIATAAPTSAPSGKASASACDKPEMDGQHGAQRRAARDADQARLGQRIAQIALQRRAGQARATAPTSAPSTARGRRISRKISAPASPGRPRSEADRADRQRQQERDERGRAPGRRAAAAAFDSGLPRAAAHRARASMPARAARQPLDRLGDMRRAAQPVPPRQLEGGVLLGAAAASAGWRRLSARPCGTRRCALASTSRSGGSASSSFERHLAAARQAIAGGRVAEAGGRQRRVGEAAGPRHRAADLVDHGRRLRRCLARGASCASRRSKSAIIASPLAGSPTAAATVRTAARTPASSCGCGTTTTLRPSRRSRSTVARHAERARPGRDRDRSAARPRPRRA